MAHARTAEGGYMKPLNEILDNPKLTVIKTGEDGGAGYVQTGRRFSDSAQVVWSFGGGWDHVSVSHNDCCPTWDEMCAVKDVFFLDDECCIEYHPPKSEYVNIHPYCLHIWKPQNAEILQPPRNYV